MTVPARLDERFGRRPLAVVTAPAGFGKTTLLRAWQRRLVATTPTATVSFDTFRRSNALDAGRALVEGLTHVGVTPSLAAELAALLPLDGESFGSEFVRAVEDALRAIRPGFVLFLDDVHGLQPAAARELGRLVSMAADDGHRVVVATRTEPPWPIRRWQLAGFADAITADELRLGVDEIAELLGSELAHLAARVAAATEGWPAAFEAVRWHLEVEPHGAIESVVLDLADYVRTEVLTALDPADLRVLARTAVLEPFPPGVATVVTGDATTPRVLAETVAHTSLVTVLDDGRLAYHAVLREALRRQLVGSEPELEGELHVRAADAWLDERDSFVGLVNAVSHLVEGRSWRRAVELLRRRWAELDVRSRLDLFVYWLDEIPGRVWRDDVELMMLKGWANLRVGRVARALEVLHDPTITADRHVAAIGKVAYASAISWTADPGEALTLCEEAGPVLAGLDDAADPGRLPAYPGVSSFPLAAEIATVQAQQMLGYLDEAAEGFERVWRRRSQLVPMVQVTLCGGHAWVLAMRGELVASERHAAEAFQLAAESGAADHMRTVPALIASATVAALRGDRATAIAQLDDAAARCRPTRAANLLRACDLVGAMCGLTRSSLADIEPRLTPATLPLVEQFVVAASARQRARRGDPGGAEAELRTTTPHELTLAAWTEVLLATGDRSEVGEWLRSQPSPTCVHGDVVRKLADAAVAEQLDEVVVLARAAAEAAAEERLLGLLVDAPGQLWSRTEAVPLGDHLLVEAQLRVADGDREGVLAALTRRELDLLRLLPLSLTIEELADRLFVSAHTVKWHRANLYRKLGVRRRDQAVAVAIESGLLGPLG